jgi:hypothetical protein
MTGFALAGTYSGAIGLAWHRLVASTQPSNEFLPEVTAGDSAPDHDE